MATAPENTWQEKFRTGEKVRLFGTPAFHGLFVLLTLGAVLIFSAWVALIRYFFTSKLPFYFPESGLVMISIFAVGLLWFPFTIYCWGCLYFVTLQFSKLYFEHWNWLGKPRRIEYAGLQALLWKKSFTFSPLAPWRQLELCYRDDRRFRGLRLRSELVPKELLQEELRRRAELQRLGGNAQAGEIWLSPHAPQTGQYRISPYPRGGMLLGRLALLLAGIIIFIIFRDQWLALGANPPEGFGWLIWLLILIGLLLILAWLLSLPKFGPRSALAVAWDEQQLSLLTQGKPREKIMQIIPWAKVVRLALPPYPGRGRAQLFIADEAEPYEIYLAEDGDCFALLSLLQSKHLTAEKNPAAPTP